MRRHAAGSAMYAEILRGLAAYYGGEFIDSVARTTDAFPSLALANALNRKQLACKVWLLDHLHETFGGRFGEVWILGGWFGVLAAMMRDDARFVVGHITSFDVDPHCCEVAVSMNLKASAGGQFSAETVDMRDLDYGRRPELVINTSCEHIADLPGWLDLLADGQMLVLQSNDYFGEPDHVNCVESLAEFKAQAQLSTLLYEGELPMKNYTRFMLIGRK